LLLHRTSRLLETRLRLGAAVPCLFEFGEQAALLVGSRLHEVAQFGNRPVAAAEGGAQIGDVRRGGDTGAAGRLHPGDKPPESHATDEGQDLDQVRVDCGRHRVEARALGQLLKGHGHFEP
jgi:hypothetical protein